MGQGFAFVFDIAVVALLVGLTFAGFKKGFARVIIEMLSLAAAFLLALWISEPIAQAVYDSAIKQPAEKMIADSAGELDDLLNKDFFSQAELDFSKVTISGTAEKDFQPNFSGTHLAAVDLTSVDMTGTGLEKLDLTYFGVEPDTDFSELNVKTAEFSADDIEKYGVGKLVAAQFLASNAVKSGHIKGLEDLLGDLSGFLPASIRSGASDMTVSTVRGIIVEMLDGKTTGRAALMDRLIRPAGVTVIRTIAFLILFILISIVLSIAARAAKMINKIPVIGKANEILGAAAGFVQGAAIVLVAALVTRMIVSLCGGEVILFNETAVQSTLLFKEFYNFELISF